MGITSCISKQAIGIGYTNQSKIAVYEKPSLQSEILMNLNQNQIYDIIGKNIPDNDSKLKLLWQRVYINEKVGYISQEEELIRKNISSFSPVSNNRYGLVTATSLLLRDAPSQQGKVIGKLKTREIVELLLDSNSKVKIANLDGTWAKVKTSSNQIGFVFTAYVMRGETPEILKNAESIELYQPGWAILKSTPKKVYDFENGKLSTIETSYGFPEQGEFSYYDKKLVSKDGKVFFNLTKDSKNCDEFSCDDNIEKIYNGYVPSESLKTYLSFSDMYYDNFREVLKDRGVISKELVNSIDSYFNSSYDSFPDISTLYINEKEFGKRSLIQATLSYNTIYENTNTYYKNEEYQVLLKKNGNKYEPLLKGISQNMEFKDVDSDGVEEVLISNHNRSSISQTFYVFNGNEFLPLLKFNDYGRDCGLISLGYGSIDRNDKDCTTEQKKEIKHFNYKLKKNKLVPID